MGKLDVYHSENPWIIQCTLEEMTFPTSLPLTFCSFVSRFGKRRIRICKCSIPFGLFLIVFIRIHNIILEHYYDDSTKTMLVINVSSLQITYPQS